MFSNILVPTDGSPLALVAVEKAIDFARDANATITFIAVIEPFQIFSLDPEQLGTTREDYRRLAEMQAAQLLTEVEMKARKERVVCHTVRVESDSVHSAIVETAIARGCDLIAMAWKERRWRIGAR